MSRSISAGRSPRVQIDSIGGDLSLVGWESDEIVIKADDNELHVTQNGEEVLIVCDDDASIRLPKHAEVRIVHIGGDAAVRGVTGGLEIKEIGGDLSIRDVESVSIDTIHADLSVRGAKGSLYVRKAHCDVSVREVNGNVNLESVVDDLVLRDVRGNIHAQVGEDVLLYLNPQPGLNYSISAGDDILLVMPPKANATLALSADEIEFDWKGVDIEEDATSASVTLGDGSANISLAAGGDIRVSNQANAGESAEDFGNFAGMGFDWGGFGDMISRQVERATRNATRKADEAARRMERRGPRVNVGVGRWNWDLGPKGPPTPPAPNVSEEERMAILKMLQEKKISAEDADKLLSALEGGE